MKLFASEYKKPRRSVEITLAPLIDVMFLLVIFFMVATVFPDNDGVTIEKPSLSSAGKIDQKSISIKITGEGNYFVEGKLSTLSDAARLVKLAVAKEPGITVILEADKMARVNAVAMALDKFKAEGATKFALAAERAPTPKSP